MAPIVHGLEAEYSGQINFIYLDIDDAANTDFERQLGFRVQPQFFLLDESGEILQQWLGRVSTDDFVAAFEVVLE